MKCIAGLENFEEHVLDAEMKDATIVRSCSSFEIVVTLIEPAVGKRYAPIRC
jgi:hypothetical protein